MLIHSGGARWREVVLLWQKRPAGQATTPLFDVAGDRRIEYDSIHELDLALTQMLTALYAKLRQRSAGRE